ncbi:hypothetical protein [Streptomyces chattanoogensis]|uniref:hypothetical protein n=1 Tax=Streptomyces chattanoogensis TaxID=66876 RepID=UPI0036D19B77
MNIKTTETNGKTTAQVIAGDRIVFTTPAYYTPGMAVSAAKCWVAFHVAETEVVWVPIAYGEEIEMPYGHAMKIALEYQQVRDAQRGGAQYESKRILRPLLNWVRAEYDLSTRDMAQICNWWWNVDLKAGAARGRKAVEAAMKGRS